MDESCMLRVCHWKSIDLSACAHSTSSRKNRCISYRHPRDNRVVLVVCYKDLVPHRVNCEPDQNLGGYEHVPMFIKPA